MLARRLGALGVIGVLHAVLIWSGDILVTYALLGLLLIPFRLRRPRTLLIWAGGIFLVPGLVLVVVGVIVLLTAPADPGAAQAADVPFLRDLADGARQAYGSGSYLDMVVQRLRELVIVLPFAVFGSGWFVFPMMLVGAAVARAGWVENLDDHRLGIRRVAVAGLAAGLVLNGAYAVTTVTDPTGTAPYSVLGLACSFLGAPILALGYAALATLVFSRSTASAVTRRLAAVGRMALTNYLLQSVIVTTIFYGLGFYGQVGLAGSLALCAITWAVNLIVSPIWLSRFSYGPAEWLWRRLTYGPRVKGIRNA